MLVESTFIELLKIYFGLGCPSSVLEIVSVTKVKKNMTVLFYYIDCKNEKQTYYLENDQLKDDIYGQHLFL